MATCTHYYCDPDGNPPPSDRIYGAIVYKDGVELTTYEQVNRLTDPNLTTNDEIKDQNQESLQEVVEDISKPQIKELPENTPASFYSNVQNIREELNEFSDFRRKSNPVSYEESCDAALHYVKEHFPNNIWASNESEMQNCLSTKFRNTFIINC